MISQETITDARCCLILAREEAEKCKNVALNDERADITDAHFKASIASSIAAMATMVVALLEEAGKEKL